MGRVGDVEAPRKVAGLTECGPQLVGRQRPIHEPLDVPRSTRSDEDLPRNAVRGVRLVRGVSSEVLHMGRREGEVRTPRETRSAHQVKEAHAANNTRVATHDVVGGVPFVIRAIELFVGVLLALRFPVTIDILFHAFYLRRARIR